MDLPQFTDATSSTGLTDTADSWGTSWGDFNSDGYPDLYIGNHHSEPGLLLNSGDATFTDVITQTALNFRYDRHGVAWGDFDNDGDQDLIVTVGAHGGIGENPKELWRNDGNLNFVNIAEEAGVSDSLSRGRSASWGDYDRDGDLDYFSANEIRIEVPNRLWRNNGDGTFTEVAAQVGVADTMDLYAGGFVDYDRDGWVDIFVLASQEYSVTHLYHNNRDGTFTDMANQAGFFNKGGNGYAWGDFDNDSDADLYIGLSSRGPLDTVKVEGNTILFIGDTYADQDGFDFTYSGNRLEMQVEVTPMGCFDLLCIHIGKNGVSPVTNPFLVGTNALGKPYYIPGVSSGYYIWRDRQSNQWHVRWSDPGKIPYAGTVSAPSPMTNVVPVDMEPYVLPSGRVYLWRNNGDDTFTEISQQAGLYALGNYGPGNWVDFDNDGWMDLFAADKGDLQTGNAPDHLFHNNADGSFTDVAILVGAGGETEGSTNATAWADYDRDGFLDLFTMNGGFGAFWPFSKGPSQLLHNEGNSNHWLDINLVGVASNRSGLGAVVQLTAGGQTQVLTNTDGSVGYNQDGNPLHFGLGSATSIELIVVDWPSGIHQELTDVPVDQFLVIVESGINQ
ncbi:MAG: hypothetical protein A2Z49_08425 [Chloroflexi bacterium RBG_19FT_COMBO_56_12]|nr:MAG: hypothetical protein A2Z49_08425 [Chloroflexi bacterium RBG_19FT_COMBO_56_12]